MLRKLILPAVIAASFVQHSPAQAYTYYVLHGPKCLEAGYTYPIAMAEFRYSYHRFDESTGRITDTSFTERVTSKSGFGGIGGYYWPVAGVGQNICVAITLGYMYNAYFWDNSGLSFAANSRGTAADTTNQIFSATVEMALPVGVDYKYGCDATFDKSKRFCASFGAGVYPSFGATVFKGNGGFAFKARPYVKGEIGFFAGICFKLRGTYVLGSIPYIDYEAAGPGYSESTTFKSKGTFNLSLILMPMSWKWGRSEWWAK